MRRSFLKARSPHQPWAEWQQRNREQVYLRSHGVCEAPGCQVPAKGNCHHVFGRAVHVAEPLASCVCFLVDLCRLHHDAAHRVGGRAIEADEDLDLTVMAQALIRACHRFRLASPLHGPGPWGRAELVGAARAIEAQLRQTGAWDDLVTVARRA